VKKTQEEGLNCVSFFFFLNYIQSPESDRVQSLEQCSESNGADIKEIERDKKETQAIILVPSTIWK